MAKGFWKKKLGYLIVIGMLLAVMPMGILAEEQSESLIRDLMPDYFGVTQTDLMEPVYGESSNGIGPLTDGALDPIEFWGGQPADSKFVFTFDLLANYDLTQVSVMTVEDTIEESSGTHKGVESITIYASRTLEDLFQESNKTVLKTNYEDISRPDLQSAWTISLKGEQWKQARWVSFVFTIGDRKYGACRLKELEVFGTKSAQQDTEEAEEDLPAYLDVVSDSGVAVRIYAKDGKDVLADLGARLSVEQKSDEASLEPVKKGLDGRYNPLVVYDLSLTDSQGEALELDGRALRISFPITQQMAGKKLAVLGGQGAELALYEPLNNYWVMETRCLRSYALIENGHMQSAKPPIEKENGMVSWIVLGCALVLTACSVVVLIVSLYKYKKG